MKRFIRKSWQIFTSILVVLAVLIAVALVGVRLLGFQVYTVLSGSMEPEYPVGSLIYVKEVDVHDLSVGDDITFRLDGNTIVTHRITEIIPDAEEPQSLRFRTKGLANEFEDANPVPDSNILGKAIFAIPYLGYLAYYIQRPPGLYIAISVGAILLLLSFLPELFSKEGREEDDTP